MRLPVSRTCVIAAAVASIPVLLADGGGAVHALDAASVVCTASGPPTAVADVRIESYEAVTPVRLVDTRDGTGGVAAPVGAGCTLRLDLDLAPVPTDATAVSLSLTAEAERAGFLTVYPCANGRPGTSNLNPRPGIATPNLVIGTPDVNREVCVYSLFETDLIVDLAGWWSPGPDRFRSIAPVRAVDTRTTDSVPLPAGTELAVVLAGDEVPADATAASVNLTATDTAGDGFLVAYPCGTEPPLASNVNFRRGETRAVAAIVGIGTGGAACVSSNVAVEVVVDVNGYYAPAPQFGPSAALRPTTGTRIANSLDGAGGWTGPFTADVVRSLDPVAGTPNGPEATAVTVNVTALNAAAPGFTTVYPCGGTPPVVSSVNFAPGEVTTNLVTVDLAADRTLCFLTSTKVDLIVDLFGVMTAPPGSLAERIDISDHTWPSFAVSATDYGVECGADGELGIDLEPLPSVTARVNGVVVPAGPHTVSADTDQLLTIDLRRGAERATYFLRCLPTDFPRLTVDRPGNPAPGWYLTTLTAPIATAPGFVTFTVILDQHGAPVWYKRADRTVIDLKRRSDGRLIYTPQLGATYGADPTSGYRVMSLAGTLIAEHLTVDPATNPVDHHDYVELPDGARAMLSYPLERDKDLAVLGAGYFDGDSIVDGVIQEIDADGDLVWSWRTDDHFGYREVTFPQRFTSYPGEPNGGEVDVWHLNSLDRVDDGSEDYVVSSRHLDAVFRVDHDTEQVDWILGSLPSEPGSPGYVANESGAPRLRIVGDTLGGPRRPHDARLRGDVLTLFDNRAATGQPARAVAYRIDEVARTATLLWEIRNPSGASSPGLGVNRVTPDGSVLVDWGGGLQPMFEEFTAAGVSMMTIAQPGGASYRIVKEPPTAFSAGVLRANAGGSLEAPG